MTQSFALCMLDDTLSEDIYNEDGSELDRRRIIKGAETRLFEERPNLFDIFYLNSGLCSKFLPTVCSPYVLLDPVAVTQYLELKYPREITEDEIELLLHSLDLFLDTSNRYWYFVNMFITEKYKPTEDTLLVPFNDDIQKLIDQPVDELEKLVITFEQQRDFDIDEHQKFYDQLFHKLRFFLSMAWLDRHQNDLLKSVMKTLPKQQLAHVPQINDSFLTKTQKKYRQRIYMQGEDADKQRQYNYFAKMFFDATRKIQSEHAKQHLIPQSGIEGFQYWGDEEVEFRDEIKLKVINEDGKSVLPDYEASVYMGYDWNKYNRRKYNPLNLPPKSVRGYIFRIYYPELTDRAAAPRFKIVPSLIRPNEEVPDPSYKYTAIVFEADKPYLPLCFRIVDKQWDTYRNGGTASQFVQGVYTLQITFKASLHYKGKTPKVKKENK